jgi:hypothetical protein
MTTAAAQIIEIPRFTRRRELLLGAAVTAAIAALVLAVGPAPGDAPVHLYRTFLVRSGALVWDNFWYAGTYPLASYSLFYYLPAALVGNLPLVFAAAVASTVLFSSLALRQWGRAALWPSRVFGVLAAAPMFTGLYAYSLGFTAMLATLKLLQLRRFRLAALCAVLTVGFSPLAFAFLCLVVASYAVSRRHIALRQIWFGAGLALAAGIEVLALVLFPTNTGVYPFHWIDFAGVLIVTALGVLVARRARAAAPLVAFYALWGLGSVLVYIVPSPLGDNWTRLSAFVFPVMLLTASLVGFQPRRLVVIALAAAFAYNVVPYALLVPSRLGNQTQEASFWRPAIGFLRAHERPGYRVEVVPTAEHWEAYWIPRSGFPLARGWYRQLDEADNPALYQKHLGAVSYRHWLRSTAVRYVLLSSTAPLDWAGGGTQEARLLRSGGSGLSLVFESANWRIYELPHATPLLTGPASPVVTSFGHTVIRGRVFAPGHYLLRAHYNPYWRLKGAGCVASGPNKMTILDLSRPERFALGVPGTPSGFARELFSGKRPTCTSQ